MIKQVLIGVVCGAAVLTVGILIGHYGITKSSSEPSWVKDVAKDVDESFIKKFMSEVDNIQIQENLRELTKVPHMATTDGDEQTVQFMLKRWQDPETGLDQAWREEYMVYLSFPDPTNPNKVTVVNSSDAVLHTVREKEKNYTSDQNDPEVVQPYAAFSPAGHPKGKLVYANQGKPSDYQLLNDTVDLRGTIAITRYSGTRRGDKVHRCRCYDFAEISTREDQKPSMILDYNATKGWVDNLDKVAGSYSTKRMAARWPLVIFYNMIDVSAYNAFVIWTEIFPDWNVSKLYKRRIFLEELGKALGRQHLPRTPAAAATVREIQERTAPSTTPVREVAAEGKRKRKRC